MLKNRLLSIDVFRGMTIAFMVLVNTPGSWSYVYAPLRHAEWHGCTPTDLVFPFFIFTIGLSMAFSFPKYKHEESLLWKKILKRAVLIFCVGFLLNWFPFYHKHILDVRLLGVLQRIAMAYLIAGMAVCIIKKKEILFVFVLATLLLYWAILFLGGDYSLDGNINSIIDEFFIPEKNLYGGFGIKFDPEGILASWPTAAQIVIGYLLGAFIYNHRATLNISHLKFLMVIAVGMILIGLLWGYVFPINKPLWTSSYVLLTSGVATAFFVLLLFILDIKRYRKWAFPFKVYGMNALVAFVFSGILVKLLIYVLKFESENAYSWLFTNVYQKLFGNYIGSLFFAISACMVVFVFALILYRKRIWIKL